MQKWNLRRRGNVATVAALSAIPLMGFVGMATDWGAVHTAQTQLQMGTDAAAVAAVTALPDDVKARAIAKAYAASVKIQGVAIDVQDSDIDFGTWDGSTFTSTSAAVATVVKVTGHASVAMPIVNLFGIGSIDLHATAGGGGVAGGPGPDMVIVQDTTGSFGANIAYAKAADLALVDCIHDRSDPETLVGLVKFNGAEQNLLSPDTLVPYSTHYATVSAKINAIVTTPGTGTNIASGLFMGKSMLDGSPSLLDKVIVLVTDGVPTDSIDQCAMPYASPSLDYMCNFYWGNASPTDEGLEPSPVLQAAATTMRNEIAAAGYDLHTVMFNSTGVDTTLFMDSLRANNGLFLETPNAAALTPLLNSICRQYAVSSAGLVF